MKHSTTTPTKSQAARFARLHELGCIACRLDGAGYVVQAEIHHFLSGNKRIGHDATVPLCQWHHRAIPWPYCTEAECLATHGPSFHRHTRQFRARYGTDAELLETVNGIIANG